MTRDEVARLCRCAVDRPRWQLALALLVSGWTLAWVLAQLRHPAGTPLGVLRGAVAWAGAPTGWLDHATEWLRAPHRHALWSVVAVAAGLLWAATTERAQLPGVLGWLAVLAAGEGLGYPGSVHRAVLALIAFPTALLLLSLLRRRRPVVRRVVLLPRDVLRAGVTAATLSAVVPLLAPGVLLARLLRPYLTRPPRHVAEPATDPSAVAVPRPRSAPAVRSRRAYRG